MRVLIAGILISLLQTCSCTSNKTKDERKQPSTRNEPYNYYFFAPYYYDYFPGIWYDNHGFHRQMDQWFYDYSELQFRRKLNIDIPARPEDGKPNGDHPIPKLKTY